VGSRGKAPVAGLGDEVSPEEAVAVLSMNA